MKHSHIPVKKFGLFHFNFAFIFFKKIAGDLNFANLEFTVQLQVVTFHMILDFFFDFFYWVC